jgi:hypothetical protein
MNTMATMTTTLSTNEPITRDPHSFTMTLSSVSMAWRNDPDRIDPASSQPAEERLRLARKVRFQDKITEYDSSTHYITEEERAAVWYKAKELNDLTKEDKQKVQVERQFGLHSRSNDFCLRGLEAGFSRRSRIETRVRKVSVLQAVFVEQHSQRMKNINDPSRIRRRCSAASKPARQLASKLASEDAFEVSAFRTTDSPNYDRSGSFCLRKELCVEKIQIDRSTRTIRCSLN